jgi:hypothetical protein
VWYTVKTETRTSKKITYKTIYEGDSVEYAELCVMIGMITDTPQTIVVEMENSDD